MATGGRAREDGPHKMETIPPDVAAKVTAAIKDK